MHDQAHATREPSARRVRDARARGFLPISAPLVGAVSLAAALAAAVLTGAHAISQLQSLLASSIARATADPAPDVSMLATIAPVARICAPIIIVGSVAAILTGALQTRFAFAGAAVKPDIHRLVPQGPGNRRGGVPRVFEFARISLALILLALITWSVLRDHAVDLTRLSRLPPERISHVTGTLLTSLVLRVTVCLVALAFVDGLWRQYTYKRALMTSVAESRREHREHFGRPAVTRARQRAQRSVDDRLAAIVFDGDVALALVYEPGRAHAPTLRYRASGAAALSMIDRARSSGIPAYHAPRLVAALATTATGHHIPPTLYRSVADIITRSANDPKPDLDPSLHRTRDYSKLATARVAPNPIPAHTRNVAINIQTGVPPRRGSG